MVRRSILFALLIVASTSCASTGTSYFGFSVGVTNAPPPPRVVFVEEPDIVLVPGTRVYVVEDPAFGYDAFRCGSYWYLYYQGYWYRSSSYSRGFAVVDVRYVPRAIVTLPDKHWKHHPHGGPPGLRKKRGGPAA